MQRANKLTRVMIRTRSMNYSASAVKGIEVVSFAIVVKLVRAKNMSLNNAMASLRWVQAVIYHFILRLRWYAVKVLCTHNVYENDGTFIIPKFHSEQHYTLLLSSQSQQQNVLSSLLLTNTFKLIERLHLVER